MDKETAPSFDLFGEVPKRSKNEVIRSVLTQDSMTFWNKNLYLLLSNDKRKHKKCFRKLHELKI